MIIREDDLEVFFHLTHSSHVVASDRVANPIPPFGLCLAHQSVDREADIDTVLNARVRLGLHQPVMTSDQ
jgi:hypothetical protein